MEHVGLIGVVPVRYRVTVGTAKTCFVCFASKHFLKIATTAQIKIVRE